MKDAAKILARRDSCTSILRKMGIHSRDYDAFIETTTDGKFVCQVARAEMHLASLKNPLKANSMSQDFPPGVNTTKKTDRTISTVAREMIIGGKTNEEVWAAIKAEFNLGDSKKSYPSWFRCECRRKGLI